MGCKPPAPDAAATSLDEAPHPSPITRHSQLDSVLAQLKVVPFAQIDTAYLRYAGIEGQWKHELSKKTWHHVDGDQAMLFLVGKFRVRDFMAHRQGLRNPQVDLEPQDREYFCMDHRVLHKLLDLLTWMEGAGLATDQLLVNYAFRHPTLNLYAGGVARSRHQWGEAIDLAVGDVNRDGLHNDADKQPLLHILETKIIGNGGGVGRYPGTCIIHMDVRGRKARWEHQGPSAKSTKWAGR